MMTGVRNTHHHDKLEVRWIRGSLETNEVTASGPDWCPWWHSALCHCHASALTRPCHVITLDQSEVNIQVTWSPSANQRWDWCPGHVITLSQSETNIRLVSIFSEYLWGQNLSITNFIDHALSVVVHVFLRKCKVRFSLCHCHASALTDLNTL